MTEQSDVPVGDMTTLAGLAGSGAVWSLPHGGDLDANVVRVAAGEAIDEHVNEDVDVLVAVWSGDGQLTVAGESIALAPGVIVSIASGLRRSIWAGSADLVYLSVHRRRSPLSIRPSR